MKIALNRYLTAFCCFVFSHWGLAQLMNIDSAVAVLKTLKEDTNKVILLDRIAWDVSYSNLQVGLDYSKGSYELAKKLNYERIYARICNTQGCIYDDKAEFAKALSLYMEGLKYARKYGQIRLQGIIYNSLGNLYTKRNELAKSLSYYLRSVETVNSSGIVSNSAYTAYGNIAGIYTRKGRLDSAMYYLNLCLDYNKKNGEDTRLINNYILLAEIYYVKNDKVNCLKSANSAVELAIKMNDTYTLAHAYIQQGLAYELNEKVPEAIESMHDAIKCARLTGDVPALEEASKFISRIYERTSDFKNSLKFYKEYKLYKDSSLNNESIQQVKNAEAKYDNEKKQKEIELLGEKQKLNQAENQKKKIYLLVAILGIIVLVFVLVILYRNNMLKQKTNKNLEAFNQEINHQKELVDIKNKEITDSINYANRIQQSILTSDNYFKKYTSDFFILFKPKDIVSGDFYWALNHENKFTVMTADCTGHGVPGAMMSMMGINFLNEIVNEKGILSPADILNQLRSDIIKTLNPEGSTIETKDGMDCCLCSFDFKNLKLTYANANNRFYIVRNSQLIVSQSDKMPVGAGHSVNKPFAQYVMDIQKDDLVITLTDGYADQFGGQKGKKYKYKQLEELLISNAGRPLHEIKKVLDDQIEFWRGDLEQVDDICILGIKV